MTPQGPADPRPPVTSRRHPDIVRIRKYARRPALTQPAGCFLLDGIHLFEEALAASCAAETVLWSPRLERQAAGRVLLARMRGAGWPLRAVTDDLLDTLALTRSPQGVVGLFRRRPGPHPLPRPLPAAPMGTAALVLAGLQDPVNVGVLGRAARAFGCPLLIALDDTVDPFHPRALRASSGLLLHLEVATAISEAQLRAWIDDQKLRAAALVPRGGEPLAVAATTAGGVVLVLGSEGRGLAPTLEAACTQRWCIPMAAGIDSLGVAAAGTIALYALAQDRVG
ncbi:MAG: RNA methyltransferase [Candidatus Eisenbacteria sp.]|nr:RNA methyltransferase [Candidatus Eisenbacteria bacterium]